MVDVKLEILKRCCLANSRLDQILERDRESGTSPGRDNVRHVGNLNPDHRNNNVSSKKAKAFREHSKPPK